VHPDHPQFISRRSRGLFDELRTLLRDDLGDSLRDARAKVLRMSTSPEAPTPAKAEGEDDLPAGVTPPSGEDDLPPGITPPSEDPRDVARLETLWAFLHDRWGDPVPTCPFCRRTSWSIDPQPVVLPRSGSGNHTGVPMFIVWCTHCGYEATFSAALPGLFHEAVELLLADEGTAGAPPTEGDGAEPEATP
jgi:hypothetical protein